MPRFDQLRHLTIEERQQQRADVGAIDVGVGHDDDLVVAQLVDVELFPANAGAQRRDQRADFLDCRASGQTARVRRSGSYRAGAKSPDLRVAALLG